MTEITEPLTWLTQEAYDRLKDELDFLSGEGRAEIVKRIEQARDEGDLKENGGYHAAKDEQGKIEARIRQLEDMMRRAEVGETPADNGIVEPGMKVTYKFVGDDDTAEFLLGNKALEDGKIDVFSPESPLGAAILGAKGGAPGRRTRPPGQE